MRRVAAIDCGTNSARLLLADVDDQGVLHQLDRRMEITRLGQGVDATGELRPEAIERTLAVLGDYAAQIEAAGADGVRFVATSASRDARNAAVFVDGVRRVLKIEPEVISGNEEAELSFRGATSGTHDEPGPYLVIDIGGGSTEFVLGTEHVEQAISIDMGSVRLTERHFRDDPPTSEQIAAAAADAAQGLAKAEQQVPVSSARTLIGVAGSITSITAHGLDLPAYDSSRVHGARFTVPEIQAACRDLYTMPRAQRAQLGHLHPGRVDVIGAGALIWQTLVERITSETGITTVITSEHDILDGIALSVAER